ncbi:MAG: hypothetical protein Dbin4_00691 [Alphaproteobacteria bacterium]|nr:hypothetical protein [Alphaproteobacteria bacterium]
MALGPGSIAIIGFNTGAILEMGTAPFLQVRAARIPAGY